jgi:hypothetical protein
MGKLIYSLNVSLDGYVETIDHGLDWSVVDGELYTWFNDQTRSLDAERYGRRIDELMAAYWPAAESDPSSTARAGAGSAPSPYGPHVRAQDHELALHAGARAGPSLLRPTQRARRVAGQEGQPERATPRYSGGSSRRMVVARSMPWSNEAMTPIPVRSALATR